MLHLLPVLLACQPPPDHGGTAVGNPTGMTLDLAPAGGVSYASAVAKVATVTEVGCYDLDGVLRVDAEVDLLGRQVLNAVSGHWCSVSVQFASPLAIEVLSSTGGKASLSLNLSEVRVDALEETSGADARFVFELAAPGWTSATGLGIDAGQVVAIDATNPAYPALVESISASSALYLDSDADGHVGSSERAAGSVAHARTDGGDDTDSGSDTDAGDTGDTDEDSGHDSGTDSGHDSGDDADSGEPKDSGDADSG